MAEIIMHPSEQQLDGVNHVSALVVNPDGLIPMAMLVKNGGHWSLPKGVILDDETVQDALFRNFTEETGIAPTRLESVKPLAVTDRYSEGRKVTHRAAYFIGRTMARATALRPRSEGIKIGGWAGPIVAIDRLHNPTDIEVLVLALPDIADLIKTMRV